MRRVRPRVEVPNELVAPEFVGIERSAYSLTATLVTVDGQELQSACLRCSDRPCERFTYGHVAGRPVVENVCPTNAIHGATTAAGPVIGPACVGCGACAMTCPVGAIAVADPEAPLHPLVVPPDVTGLYRGASSRGEFLARRAAMDAATAWSPSASDEIVDRLYPRAASLTQRAFYPLVASLFTAAGFPAWMPPHGDTNNRMDVLLVDAADSLPVEVKSRTETGAINVKSVQQALENKILLDERKFVPALRSSSTLVVGYDYPAERSDVTELVDDIKATYDISIGLISLRALYRLALTRRMTGIAVPRTTLSTLMGKL